MKKSLIAAALLPMLAACGGSNENPEARALMDQAGMAYDNGQFELSSALLDSIQKCFPEEIGIQRESMTLRPQVIEQTSVRKIAEVDSMILVDKADMERLKPALKWVKTPGMIEGYWIDAKAYNPNFMNTTGLEARVSEIGQFYIVSSANPSSLKHTSITLSDGKQSVTTEDVPYDGESNYRIGGGEVITFSPEQSDTLGVFASGYAKAGAPGSMTLTFNGAKGKKSIKLSKAQAHGIATAYDYSKAVIRARDNEVERKRLERTIELARSQAAKIQTSAED